MPPGVHLEPMSATTPQPVQSGGVSHPVMRTVFWLTRVAMAVMRCKKRSWIGACHSGRKEESLEERGWKESWESCGRVHALLCLKSRRLVSVQFLGPRSGSPRPLVVAEYTMPSSSGHTGNYRVGGTCTSRHFSPPPPVTSNLNTTILDTLFAIDLINPLSKP